jgi:hypothetical protein
MSGEDTPRPYLENLIVPEIKTNKQTKQNKQSREVMSGEDAPRPYLENLIVLEIVTNKQIKTCADQASQEIAHEHKPKPKRVLIMLVQGDRCRFCTVTI